VKRVGFASGVMVFVYLHFFVEWGQKPSIASMAAIAAMMSVFWVTEAVPLAVTSLLPLIFFPICGIASSNVTASQYMNSTVFLLLGGFLIALAMEQWGLHKRFAIYVLLKLGSHPVFLLLGFMLSSAGLSMWISNTATTLMMLPIVLAVCSKCQLWVPESQQLRLQVGLLLGIAYSASIGGMMTLVGTAPNLVFSRFYQTVSGDSFGFLQWMLIAVPIGMVVFGFAFLVLYQRYFRNLPVLKEIETVLLEEKRALGSMGLAERQVLWVFFVTAVLWVSRKGLQLNGWSWSGWGAWFESGKLLDDGTVAVAMAAMLFILPARSFTGSERILSADAFRRMPWDIVLLFGGGFALAFGFTESGLSVFIAEQWVVLQMFSVSSMILAVAAVMSLLTELTSNTATTQLVMPILLSMAQALAVSPIQLMLPATLAASCAFMFPVATPPNAIIFASGKVRVMEMVVTGFLINIFAVISIVVLALVLIPFGTV
jgi:sodium-dependent dicarboxylate transporter 2/3/5